MSASTLASEVSSVSERSSRTVSFNTSPVSYVRGGYNLGAQVRVTDRFTLGPKGYLFDFASGGFRDGVRIGARAHAHLGEHWQDSGALLKLGAYWDDWRQQGSRGGNAHGPPDFFGNPESFRAYGISVDALIGYQWSVIRDRMTLDLSGGLECLRRENDVSAIPEPRPVIEAALAVSF